MLNRPDEMCGAATFAIHGEIDQAEMTGCKLFSHKNPANFPATRAPYGLLHSLADFARQSQDHSPTSLAP
jgi:hypothetical protein